LFSTARWRLTIAFTVALVLILGAAGLAVYLITSSLIYDQVDAELAAKAGNDSFLLDEEHRGPGPREEEEDEGEEGDDEESGNPPLVQQFEQGGYFFAVTDGNGEIVEKSGNCDAEALVSTDVLSAAAEDGSATAETVSSSGDQQQVYVLSGETEDGTQLFLQIGRSIESELETLSRLRAILIAVVAFSAVPALAGGYVLSGRALRPIKAAMDSQQAFLADASHELRTPVAVVRTNAEILERHAGAGTLGGSPNDETAVQDILAESERLGRMVGQMLTLAQSDAGRGILMESDLSLDTLADDVVRSMRSLAQAGGLTLDLAADRDLWVHGDGERLREVLVTLIDNAIKYTPAGGRIEVAVRRHGKKARLTVSDTGSGIPPESLPHLFDRFYRVDKARSRDAGGTGLGLAIAKQIVEAHDGDISATSSPGEGTTMTVELRLLPHAPAPGPSHVPEPHG
jgi:signal transduction histidine kinase